METNASRKRGAQPGNRNAVKHGRYRSKEKIRRIGNAAFICCIRNTLKMLDAG